MPTPDYEVVRIVHPNIPGSEHDVPLASLAIRQRSGWVRADQQPETDEAPEPKEEAKQPAKQSRTTTKKEEG